MTVAALGLAATHSPAMPYLDEWNWIAQVAHREPVTLPWLWSLHNEQRPVLPRLIYLGCGSLTGFNFRAMPILNALILSVLAMALMLTARHLRGYTLLYDGFFPFTVLHWGQTSSLIWGFQVAFVVGVALLAVPLLLIARCRGPLSGRSAIVITACLLAGGLCGAMDLPYLAALAGWLIFAGVIQWQSRKTQPVRRMALLWGCAAALIALVVAYFRAFTRAPQHHASPDVFATLRTALEFMTNSLGPGVKPIFPVAAALILLGCLYTAGQAAGVLWFRAEERVRAAGFLGFLMGVSLLALGIGSARAFLGAGAGFADRYVTLAMPLLCLFYLQWLVYSRAAVLRYLQPAMFLLMGTLSVVNAYQGLRTARGMVGPTLCLEADMREGIPSDALAVRYADRLAIGPTDVFARQLAMLYDARLGPYRDRAENAPANLTQVRRMADLAAAEQPGRGFLLRPGRQFSQSFFLPENAGLYRMDVQMGPLYRHLRSGLVDWTLRECPSAGNGVAIFGGRADRSQLIRDDCLSLRFPPLSLPGPRRFELVFSVPADVPAANSPEFLLYDSTPAGSQCLKGYLFLLPKHP